jgi:histidine triad (HIT) family protein
MSEPTIFDKIVTGDIPAYTIWEDANYMAFLTPFANTSGFTVVIPKVNPGENYLSVEDKVYSDLLLASKQVAQLLRKAFNVQRVGLIIEGEGVPHLHVKLIPMHGQHDETGPHPGHIEFYEEYPGYLTTIEGPKMSDEQLTKIQKIILKAGK